MEKLNYVCNDCNTVNFKLLNIITLSAKQKHRPSKKRGIMLLFHRNVKIKPIAAYLAMSQFPFYLALAERNNEYVVSLQKPVKHGTIRKIF